MMIHKANKQVSEWHHMNISQPSGTSVKYLLWDSGSDEHLCQPVFGGDQHTEECRAELLGISGKSLGKLGKKRVSYKIVGENGNFLNAITEFKVSQQASKDVLSAGKMSKNGFVADMRNKFKPYLSHPDISFRIPLYIHRNSYYIKIVDDEAVPYDMKVDATVAPVVSQGDQYDWEFAGVDEDEEGIEMIPLPEEFARDEAHARADRQKLHGWSKVADLRARLKELDEPIYGDKHTLWTRLKKAEAALNARRASARDYVEKHSERQQALREGRGAEVQELPKPVIPSDEEMRQHALTHLPPQPWCEFCTRDHGVEIAHKRRTLEQKLSDNHFELDYSFLKTDTSLADKFEECSDTVLSVVDTGTGMGLAFSIPAKNLGIPYVVKVITSFIAQLGYDTVKLRSDNEPAIKKVKGQIAEALRKGEAPGAAGLKIIFEEVPRYSSQSLGTMGAFQKLLRGDVLTLRYAVEAEYGITLHTSHNLWPWLVRYCSFIRCRYAVKSNQRTAYQDAFDCQYTSPLIPFAETVLFKTPMSKARRAHGRNVITKGETAWAKGIYLGRSVTSNEYLLGTPDGTVSARSVRRFADSAKTHDRDLLEAMIGVPWDQGTTIGRPKRKIEAIMPMTPSAVPTEAETDEKKAKIKTFEEEPTEPTLNQGGPSSGSGRNDEPILISEKPANVEPSQEAMETEQVIDKSPMEIKVSARRAWPGGDDENPEKRARVGGVYVGALYSPTEDVIVYEEDVEMAAVDSDDEESKPLTAEERAQGREVEYGKMDKYDTYEPVSYQPGMKVLDATWVEVRKPDGAVRCRYCVREFKQGDPRTDVFAVASSTSTSRVVDVIGIKMGYAFMTADAENAFWQVPIKEDAYMLPPKDWIEKQIEAGVTLPEKVVWKLKKEWYGRRIAGQCFVEWAAGHLKDLGFSRNPAAPWLFHNSSKGILMEVHMDDFFATGPQRSLEELEKELHKRIRMKSQIHPLIEGEKFTHLKRTREIYSNGIFISPRSKYITDLLKMLKLENCNPAPTPYVHSEVKEGQKLNESCTKLFRAGVGIALYLSYDRTDIQFAIRELTKDMKDPNDGSMAKLHRLARYLQGTKDYGIWLERRGDIETLVVHSDTDWANCKKTRKSCACAMFSVGGCLLYSYARSLQMLCLSSGEAEFNGGVAACAEGLFLKEIFMFAGHPIKMEVFLDSSAARGVFQRQGVGRIRHLEVKSLWVQEALQRKLFTLHAVPSSDNTADFGTKALTIERFHKLRTMLKIGTHEEVSEKEKNHVNVVSTAGQFSKKMMIAALITMLQQADGAREADEPNAESGTLSQWIFTDLAVAFTSVGSL